MYNNSNLAHILQFKAGHGQGLDFLNLNAVPQFSDVKIQGFYRIPQQPSMEVLINRMSTALYVHELQIIKLQYMVIKLATTSQTTTGHGSGSPLLVHMP